MRLFKKLAAGLFSAALALSFAAPMMPVLAADDDTIETRDAQNQTATVKLNGSIKNASYEGYLIFTGTWKDNNLGTPVLNPDINNLAEYIIQSLHKVTGAWPEFSYYNGDDKITIAGDTTTAASGSLPADVDAAGYVTGDAVDTKKIEDALGEKRFAEQLLDHISSLNRGDSTTGADGATINSGKAKEFADDLSIRLANAAVNPTLSAIKVTEDNPGGTLPYTATFNNVRYGYYLFVTAGMAQTDEYNSASTGMLVRVNKAMAGNNDIVNVNIKASVPTVDKYVSDYDSTGKDKDFQPSVDAGLLGGAGSEQINGLAYRLIGGVASNYNDYSWYKYEFVDTLPTGIQLTKDRLIPGTRTDANTAQHQWAWKAYEVKNYKDQNMPLVNPDGSAITDITDVSDKFTPNVTTDNDGRSVITWTVNTANGLKDFAPTIN